MVQLRIFSETIDDGDIGLHKHVGTDLLKGIDVNPIVTFKNIGAT